MKKFLIPVAVGTVVFGAATAFAATLNVSSSGLGAGDAAVAACNDNARVSYDTARNATTQVYEVSSVTVTTSGSKAGCGGMTYKVTLTGAAGDLGSAISGTLASNGAGTTTGLSGVAAKDVTGASVVITG